MQAFISYANDEGSSEGVGTAFARWLYRALQGSPVVPWMDIEDLPAVGEFDRILPSMVNNRDIFLLVRTRYTTDSDVCLAELRYAREFGKPILRLLVEHVEHNHLVDHHYSVDFTADQNKGLKDLLKRVETLNKPEGQIAQLQEQLRHKRNELRWPDSSRHTAVKQEIARLDARLKELQAQHQGSAGALHVLPSDSVVPRNVHDVVAGQEAADILREISGDDIPVFIIVGPEGIGKTRLAKALLAHQEPEVVTVYQQTHGPQSFTANDLANLLKDAVGRAGLETNASLLKRLDVAVVRKLEILMDLFQDKRMVVVLDSCEALLDDETGKLVSAELDDALETLANRSRSLVKLMLVTREPPLVRGRRWLTRAYTLSLDKGLSLTEFKSVLATLDPDDVRGLRHPSESDVEELHKVTDGRPRAAEVVHGILASPNVAASEHSRLNTLADIVKALAGFDPDEALSFLTGRLIDGLTPEERRVMQAVSAFGFPVDADAVAYLLPGENVDQIDRGLKNLRSRHLVRRTSDDRYYVQRPDDSRALEAATPTLEDDQWDGLSLILRASTYFALHRQTDVRKLDDLAADFAEIDLLLQAKEFEEAFLAIENVDDHLDNWGCRWALRRQREHVRGSLRYDLAELYNLQALGDIALQRDDLAAAESFYRQAVSYLEEQDEPEVRRKLFVALGAVLQRRDEMTKAEDYYERALGIARKSDTETSEIAPLAGLAECCRHWGQLPKAVKHLTRAARLARAAHKHVPVPENQRRLADVLLKLGRRHAELGDLARGEALIAEAAVHASEVDSWITQCLHLDAAANLKLLQHRVAPARKLGQDALTIALELGRVPLQRQIYTTLAMCSLLEGDIKEAVANITSADRGRLPSRSLLTLALRGVIEYRQDNRAPAQRAFRALRLEATKRTQRDKRDFGALDMEAFARCGEHLGHAEPPLDAAVEAFRKARRLTGAPGITQQIVQLLALLDEVRLAPAMAAAAGR